MSARTTAPRGLPGWGRVLLGVIGLLVLLAVGAVVWFVAMLSGGVDDLFSGPGPAEDDARVVAARDASEPALDAALEEVRALAGTGAPAATRSRWSCAVGQHNWKIDDPYDLSCRREDAVVVAGGPTATFRADMLALHDALVAAGWESTWSPLTDVVEEYWDGPDPGSTADDGGPTYPQGLPAASYTRAGVTVEIEWLQPERVRETGIPDAYAESWPWLSPEGGPLAAATLAAALPADSYGLWLTASTTYFEE